jgi:hypothetical protein
VAQKAGISESQARQAVETVLGFLKDKLPAPLAAQVDVMIAGGSPNLGALGSLGSMFGKK